MNACPAWLAYRVEPTIEPNDHPGRYQLVHHSDAGPDAAFPNWPACFADGGDRRYPWRGYALPRPERPLHVYGPLREIRVPAHVRNRPRSQTIASHQHADSRAHCDDATGTRARS